jgi:hypothetical protein
MVIVASIYLRFYIEVGVGVDTFLPTPTPTPPKIPSDFDSNSDSTAVMSPNNETTEVTQQYILTFSNSKRWNRSTWIACTIWKEEKQ